MHFNYQLHVKRFRTSTIKRKLFPFQNPCSAPFKFRSCTRLKQVSCVQHTPVYFLPLSLSSLRKSVAVMAQVVATRSIHSSFPSPSAGSLQSQLHKIRPSGFDSQVLLARNARKSQHRAVRVTNPITARRSLQPEVIPVSPEDVPKVDNQIHHSQETQQLGDTSVSMWSKPTVRRKTKIVCTIGPSTNTREMIWKLAEAGMNVARMNMSHGDHASHQKVIDLVKEYNAQSKDNVIAIMLDTKGPEVRSGDLPQPVMLSSGQEFTFTIKRGAGSADCVSVNYDDFVNDVDVGDMLLVDGSSMLANEL